MRKIPLTEDQLRQLRREAGDDWKSEISDLASDASSVDYFGDQYVDATGKIHRGYRRVGPFVTLSGKEIPTRDSNFGSYVNRAARRPGLHGVFKTKDQGIFFDQSNPGQMMYSKSAATDAAYAKRMRHDALYPEKVAQRETWNRRSGLLALMTADSDFGYSGSKTGTVSSTPVDVSIHDGRSSIPDAVYRSKKEIEEDQALRRRITPSRSYTTAAAGPKISSKVHATSSARTRPRVTVPKK